MRVPAICIAVVLAVATCTSGHDVNRDQTVSTDGGERFDAACRFVPSGMVSYWFLDGYASGLTLPEAGAVPLVAVCAACAFEATGDQFDACRQVGVAIGDYGRNFSPALLGWPTMPDEHIAGQSVWHCSLFRGDPPESPTLSAIVDHRFLIQARRALLEAALAEQGDRHQLLQPFGNLPGLDWSVPHLVFCLPRPDPPHHPGEGREGCAVFTGSENPWRIEGWYRGGKVRTADRFGDELPQRHAGDYVVRTKDLQKPKSHGWFIRQARNTMIIAMGATYGFWFP
jgi:hypothetical protein